MLNATWLGRVGLVVEDWLRRSAGLVEAERRMVDVLNELGLTKVVAPVPGLSALGAATILAETADLSRLEFSLASAAQDVRVGGH
jgi:hypothetical protein